MLFLGFLMFSRLKETTIAAKEGEYLRIQMVHFLLGQFVVPVMFCHAMLYRVTPFGVVEVSSSRWTLFGFA